MEGGLKTAITAINCKYAGVSELQSQLVTVTTEGEIRTAITAINFNY